MIKEGYETSEGLYGQVLRGAQASREAQAGASPQPLFCTGIHQRDLFRLAGGQMVPIRETGEEWPTSLKEEDVAELLLIRARLKEYEGVFDQD